MHKKGVWHKFCFMPLTMKKQTQKILYMITGLVSGVLNGLFGAGGGLLCVPLLERSELEPKKSHATSISIILPLTIFSAVLYVTSQKVALSDVYPLIVPGIIGSIIGAFFLKKVSNDWLRRIFGAFILFAAVRMFF